MSRKVGPWALALLLTTATANAQQQQGGSPALKNDPRVLTEAEYGRIETLGPSTLSPDGKWVAYEIRRGVTAPPEFHYRAIASDSERTISHATSAAFTSNSRWLVYIIPPDTARRATVGARDTAGGGGGGGGGAPGRGTPASSGDRRNKVGMIDLRTGTATVVADIQSFALSNDGVHVALRRYAPPGRTNRGADLVVRDLAQNTDLTFGNVADFAWNDDGALLAMTIDVDGKTGNGMQLLNVATGALRSLDAADVSYGSVAWRKHGDDLAVLRSGSDSAFADTSYVILAWRGLGTARPTQHLYDFASDRAFPAGMRVAGYRAPL
ncbi:MAG TPA: hypothetical protein VE714_10500, partial [Gemmatimonadales bacterium]|nr:hypothetical protein [Gemmatimonadales bacterium]